MNGNDDKRIDDELRAAWRVASGESAPQAVDDAILARAAAAAAGRARRAGAWTRPLAYAATVALGAFLVFNISMEPPVDNGAAADRETARQRFERSADDAASALEGIAATDAASLGAGRSATPDRSAASAAADSVAPDCRTARQTSPEAWWRCAQRLREAGATAAARREIDELLRLHPGFRPPE